MSELEPGCTWILATATEYQRFRNGGYVSNSGASRAVPVPRESQGHYSLAF